MTTQTKEKSLNIIPDGYQHLISKKAHEALEANNLVVEVRPVGRFPAIEDFPFASILEYMPNPNEHLANNGSSQTHTVIKANEIGATDDDTVKNVLARLGHNIADTNYWKVYAYELDTPDESGFTRILTTNISNVPTNTSGCHFAGFGYKDINAKQLEWDWYQQKILPALLNPILLWVNNKFPEIIIRDADSGMYVAELQGVTPMTCDISILAEAKTWKERYQYAVAVHESGVHVMPTGYENILSNETKAMLADKELQITVSELQRPRDIGAHLCDKFFAVAKTNLTYQWTDDPKESKRHTAIRDEDFGDTPDETAKNLMARMDGDAENMSYWVVYCYLSAEPNEWGHIALYTTDTNELPEHGWYLAGIAISYNFHITPTSANEEEWEIRQRQTRSKHIAALSDEEKARALKVWQSDQLSRLNKAVFERECWANKKLFEVQFSRDDGESLLANNLGTLYKKDTESFNAEIQAAILKIK